MLGGIFQKRKKIQELRAPSLQDIKRFREIYGRYADARHVETPACFERSIYKAISCQKELYAIDFRQEDVTDPQVIALAETLLDMPLVSSLDLRDNRVTDDGAKALLEVLRLQIIAAKTPPKTDAKTKKLVPPPPVPEFTRYVTNVNLKGNEISASVLEEMSQYTEILKREDKRLEIRAALNQIDRNAGGGVDEEDFRAVVKLLTGTEPSKKEVKQLMSQSNVSGDSLQNSIALENVLLAKCSSSPSKKAACPPWEALVQVRHANIGSSFPSPWSGQKGGSGSPGNRTEQGSLSIVQQRSTEMSSSLQHPVRKPQTQVGQVTMTTLSSSSMGANNSSTLSPPPAPRTSSNAALSISTGEGDSETSPSKAKADFRPPSSPPPPLPLPQTTTPDRRGSVMSTSSKTRDSFENSSDKGLIAPSIASDGAASSSSHSSGVYKAGGVPLFTRQDSNESHRGIALSSPPSAAVSPKGRDDYSVDFSSWRDEDPFGESHEDFLNSPLQSPIMDGSDEAESMRTQENPNSTESRHSVIPANRSSQAGSTTNGFMSPTANFGDPSEGSSSRGQTDLSSLAYNAHPESVISGRDSSRLKSGSAHNERRQLPEHEPVLEDEREEEISESTVLDVMKDGKPRNVTKVRHTEFKRGMTLQDFPDGVPFRNLVALILSENGLRDLNLFKECRFPCTTVLDLSNNALTKISDEELACFPKLQVLDVSCNRLRVISGVGKLFDLKAFSLCNNQLRNVINIEHLVQLQILRLRSNAISAPTALRLLSLNKMLAHLDLDDNPLMETDDRQRRKVTVHILNIVPTLTTLGSVPIAGHIAKDKRKIVTADAPMGKSLLEHDECPSLRSIWASNACDILQIVQDRDQILSRSPYDEDDLYGDSGSYSPTRQKKPSREQQRQKDELRSKSVGYRSRGKAPPSPVRAKTSSFEFGPPLPPPQRKSPKKKPVVDPKRAQEQKRRASQLSEPKHPPVDPDQFKQEQRRKSRPTFDVNMSVAERLQLVRDKSLRRTSTLAPHAETGPSHRASVSMNNTQQSKRATDHVPALIMEIREQHPSPIRSPTRNQHTIEFRVEPLPTSSPRHLQENNQQMHSLPSQPVVSTEISVTGTSTEPATERKPSLKESLFLQSLAVTDFLSHAEEEISTAHTALNVLLSMCERRPSDPKKLSEYRNSLDALDILDEHESQELYERARHHDDPQKAQECGEAFEKLRTLKRCIKELLNMLETNSPGSATILSYCSQLRSTELRDIIDTIAADHDSALDSPVKRRAQVPIQESTGEQTLPSLTETVAQPVEASSEASSAKTLHSRLFSNIHSEASDTTPSVSKGSNIEDELSTTKEDDVDDFDFLSSDTKMFDDDDPLEPHSIETRSIEVEVSNPMQVNKSDPVEDEPRYLEQSETATVEDDKSTDVVDVTPAEPATCERNERSLSATSTDITQDIQQIGLDEEHDFDFDAELPLEETPASSSSSPPEMAVETTVVENASSSLDFQFDGDDHDSDGVGINWDANEEIHLEDPTTSTSGVEDVEQDGDVSQSDEAQLDFAAEEENVGAHMEQYEEQYEEQHDTLDGYEDAGAQQESQEMAAEAEDEDDEEAEVFGDWEKGFDPNTNHYFWFNHETGESQWVPPEGWPYEVDTPFEEDAEQDEDGEAELAEEYEDAGTIEAQPADDPDESPQPGSPDKSTFEADDDVFSDQDLPDF